MAVSAGPRPRRNGGHLTRKARAPGRFGAGGSCTSPPPSLLSPVPRDSGALFRPALPSGGGAAMPMIHGQAIRTLPFRCIRPSKRPPPEEHPPQGRLDPQGAGRAFAGIRSDHAPGPLAHGGRGPGDRRRGAHLGLARAVGGRRCAAVVRGGGRHPDLGPPPSLTAISKIRPQVAQDGPSADKVNAGWAKARRRRARRWNHRAVRDGWAW
ncbi:hypothetical protein FBZ88_102221 [Nitrospirillum bahiense]|uniref:Uncharacterized protein n=1 Tax=Nitrospirillum amazonense TaxID=28077 RepID=A0A560G9T4_9PROT|nr:hypothetical protein FBZ88_102221 [Nitrospirillum amazonense]